MKFSLAWLATYVDLPADPLEVASLLAAAGFPVDAVDPWGADHQLDVDVMANRPDCMGHLGLARELAARLHEPLRYPDAPVERDTSPAIDVASVEIEQAEDCPRYTALVIEGVTVEASPDWLVDRLASIGLRPINTIVDVTNFVLHEYGQPLHAFDLDRLAGRRIVVRRARQGESIETLDGISRALGPDHLVIADGERPVALAGIMGGSNSEITPATTRVLLESAHFNPGLIRRSAKRFQIHTDASHRFERGTDPGVTRAAALRAASLLTRTAGGRTLTGDLDVGIDRVHRRTVSLSMTRLRDLLGLPVEPESVMECLSELGFEAAPPEWDSGDARLAVVVPTWRADVVGEVDLIEEVARQIGYDSIPSTLPEFSTDRTGQPSPSAGRDRVRRYLAASGYHEGLGFPMHDRQAQDVFRDMAPERARFITLSNPLNLRMDTLRFSLIPGLVEGVLHNLRRGNNDVRLFEVGRVFFDVDDATRPEGADIPLPVERTHVAVVAHGAGSSHHWQVRTRPAGFFDLKGVLEGLAATVLGQACDIRPLGTALPFLDGDEAGFVHLDDSRVGFIGRLTAQVAPGEEVPADLFAFEIDISRAPIEPPLPTFRPPPRHPPVARDLALILDTSVRYSQVDRTIRQAGGDLLESIEPFDHYAGKPIPEGRYSLAIHLSFRHTDRTLTAGEVSDIQAKIVGRLSSELGAYLRDGVAAGPNPSPDRKGVKS